MSTKGLLGARISTDTMLGAVGCGLAVSAATFGIFMTIHGPVESLGKSKDFSVFAQLAPQRAGVRAARDDLDMTTTASISSRAAAPRPVPETGGIVPGITLASVMDGRAEIVLDGETRSVRVGDTIPGAGEVLAIRAGRDPSVRTSVGMIVAGR